MDAGLSVRSQLQRLGRIDFRQDPLQGAHLAVAEVRYSGPRCTRRRHVPSVSLDASKALRIVWRLTGARSTGHR
jgi:hypothetical protein